MHSDALCDEKKKEQNTDNAMLISSSVVKRKTSLFSLFHCNSIASTVFENIHSVKLYTVNLHTFQF